MSSQWDKCARDLFVMPALIVLVVQGGLNEARDVLCCTGGSKLSLAQEAKDKATISVIKGVVSWLVMSDVRLSEWSRRTKNTKELHREWPSGVRARARRWALLLPSSCAIIFTHPPRSLLLLFPWRSLNKQSLINISDTRHGLSLKGYSDMRR
jgi:hypothetical protein